MPEENRQPHLGAPPGGSTRPSAHLGPEPQDPESPGSSPRPRGPWEGRGLGKTLCDPEHAALSLCASVSQLRDGDLEVTGLDTCVGRVAQKPAQEVTL